MMSAEYQHLLHTHYALPFAAWEIRLYLNSHPHDRAALKLYQQWMNEPGCAHYAGMYPLPQVPGRKATGSALDCMDQAACSGAGNLEEWLVPNRCECPVGDCCPLSWAWVEGPWPWEGDCRACAD